MTHPRVMTTATLTLLTGIAVGTAIAQQGAAPAGPVPYSVGNRLGMPINPPPTARSRRCRTTSRCTGRCTRPRAAPTIRFAASSSCRIAAWDRTSHQRRWITFLNHDGSVHTSRWIGVQNPGDQRNNMTPPLVLNEPLGSDIANGVLYLADRDGGTGPNDPAVSVVRTLQHADRRCPAARSASRNRPASTTSRSPTTARSTRRRREPADRIPMPRRGRSGRSRPTAMRRSSSRARRCVSPTASPSTRRATSSSSTSAPRTSSRSRRMAK